MAGEPNPAIMWASSFEDNEGVIRKLRSTAVAFSCNPDALMTAVKEVKLDDTALKIIDTAYKAHMRATGMEQSENVLDAYTVSKQQVAEMGNCMDTYSRVLGVLDGSMPIEDKERFEDIFRESVAIPPVADLVAGEEPGLQRRQQRDRKLLILCMDGLSGKESKRDTLTHIALSLAKDMNEINTLRKKKFVKVSTGVELLTAEEAKELAARRAKPMSTGSSRRRFRDYSRSKGDTWADSSSSGRTWTTRGRGGGRGRTPSPRRRSTSPGRGRGRGRGRGK